MVCGFVVVAVICKVYSFFPPNAIFSLSRQAGFWSEGNWRGHSPGNHGAALEWLSVIAEDAWKALLRNTLVLRGHGLVLSQ